MRDTIPCLSYCIVQGSNRYTIEIIPLMGISDGLINTQYASNPPCVIMSTWTVCVCVRKPRISVRVWYPYIYSILVRAILY
jgi:hypothetical protein